MKRLAALILLFLHTVAKAQLDNHNFRYFNQSSGLSSSNVKKITQDNNGFMWMGTQDGITRFNGSESVIMKRPALQGTDVSDIFFDSRTGWLWVSYSLGGINAIDTRTLNVVYSSAGKKNISRLATIPIRALITDKKQQLWIGSDNGLFCIPDLQADKIDTVQVLSSVSPTKIHVAGLAEDNNGNLLVAWPETGVLLLENGHPDKQKLFSFHEKKAFIYNTSFNKKRNDFLLAGRNGVYSFNADQLSLELLAIHPDASIPEEAFCAAEDDNGNIWVSLRNGMYYRQRSSHKTERVNFSQGKQTDLRNIAVCIYSGRQSSVWIGTMAGCYYSLTKPSLFIKIRQTEKANLLNHLYFLYPQKDKLLACDETGLYRTNLLNRRTDLIDSSQAYHLFFTDFKKNTIASTSRGLFAWNDQPEKTGASAAKLYPELAAIQDNSFASVFYKYPLIILGSENNTGICIWNTEAHTVTVISDNTSPYKLSDASVIGIFKKSDDQIFVLTNSSLEVLNLNTFQTTDLTSHFPGMNYFYDIVSLQSKYFIGTYGSGITETDTAYKTIRKFTTKEGLSNDCVYRIIPESDSIVWATTNFGLNRININSGHISAYYSDDGLHANEFEEYSACKDEKYIYAGGINGFTIINPANFTVNTAVPNLYYNHIKVRTEVSSQDIDTTNLIITKLTIPNNWLQANISFTGLNYSNPTRVTYQYRIREQDTSWIPLQAQNFVTLIGLSPGRYTLEVKAANEDGYWSMPKQLTLVFEPRWYQTWLFTVSVALAVLLLFYGFYRYRIANIKRQQQIRQSISSDLHDDIGATLNSVKLFTHLALTTPKKEEYLNQITGLLQQATTGLRDMIWVLDDTRDTVQDLMNRIRQFALPVAEAAGIHITFAIDENSKDELLSKSEKRNLFLIVKESVTNSVKYAVCSRIVISLQQSGKKRVLIIEDNGKGFVESEVQKGNGLFNIRLRAEQIRYTPQIVSAPNNGTKVAIEKR